MLLLARCSFPILSLHVKKWKNSARCATSMSYFAMSNPPQHLFSVLADLLTDSEAAEPQARRVYTVCFIPKPPPCPPWSLPLQSERWKSKNVEEEQKKRIKQKNWNRASGLYMTTNGKEVFSPGSLLLISRIWDQINKPLVTKMQIKFLICLIQPLTFLQRFLFALCELQIVNISAGHSGIF